MSLLKKNNIKNEIRSYENFCNKEQIKLLNTEKNDLFIFDKEKIISEEYIQEKYYKDKDKEEYLINTKKI